MEKISDSLTLHNGLKIPGLGFGVWQISPLHTAKCVKTAIKAGYRNIDTAEGYMNEKGVGEGVRQAMDEYGLNREDIFVSTKLWNDNRGYDKAMKAFEVSLKKLGLEYLDLYLIHWPAVARGRIKAIGVSNFLAHHVQALTEDSDIKPMVNQIEYHPGFGQVKSAEYCQANGIVVEAWSPLGSGGVLRNGELNRIAGKYKKSAAQICIRWLLQKNIVPLPKSTHEKYITENADVFDFSLSEEDMAAIDRIPYCGGMMFDPDSARS